MNAPTRRFHETVYVIGAGFSAALDYPLTNNLLLDVWERLRDATKEGLAKVIRFHHPEFDPDRRTSFPNVEQLLTEVAVNLDLFDASRPAEGNFKQNDLYRLREQLLYAIAQWFHEIYSDAREAAWLHEFGERLQEQRAGIISFNWDLILDHLLFSEGISPESYGLASTIGAKPVLLKPHGSLNWYDAHQVSKVAAEKRVRIFSGNEENEHVEAFLYPRKIKSKFGRQYTPLIVPPTYLKDFNRPIFKLLWNRCTAMLSTARTLVFIGYSLPAADLQAQFILRCGFHNQTEGRLSKRGTRLPATGPADVVIVNPDQGAAQRIEKVAGHGVRCNWIPKRAADWIELHA